MTNRERLSAFNGGAEFTLGMTDKQIDTVIESLVEKGLIRIPNKRSKAIELTELGEQLFSEMQGESFSA